MGNVLIVDDDPDIRASLRMLLEEIGGYEVSEAADGVEALEALRASSTPLVVLLDLLMPRLDGLGVLQAAAADAQLASRHAYILLTVSRAATLPEFATQTSLHVTVVPKPFDINTVLEVVAAAERRLGEAQRP